MPTRRRRHVAAPLVGVISLTAAIVSLSHLARTRDVARQTQMNLAAQAGATNIYRPPHIVLVTVDDLGWNDIGYQSSDIPGATPFMTQLASQGVRLTQYYGQEMCTPARASLMSGRWPHSMAFQDTQITEWSTTGVPLRFDLMPQRLQQASLPGFEYYTVGFGKWNLGFCNESYLPWSRGFEHFTGYMSQGVNYYSYQAATYTYHNSGSSESRALYDLLEGNSDGTWAPAKQYQGNYSTSLYRDLATAAIARHAGAQDREEDMRPLFMWVAFHAVHRDDSSTPPMDVFSEMELTYLEKLETTPGVSPNRIHDAELIMPVDDGVRAIYKSLVNHNMMDDTVLVVHSDNGGDSCHAAGDSAPWGSNWPLRGRKMSYFEGGVRVPAFIYSPRLANGVAGTTYDGLMHHVDWVATFVALASGKEFSEVSEGDGINQWPAINGKGPSPRQELIFDLPQNKSFNFEDAEGDMSAREDWHGVVAVRRGDLKLLYTVANETWFPPHTNTDLCPRYALVSECETNTALSSTCEWSDFLFNVSSNSGGDPTEQHNLYYDSNYADELASLKSYVENLLGEMKSVEDPYASRESQVLAKTTAQKAYHEAGDWVVPWGCAAVH